MNIIRFVQLILRILYMKKLGKAKGALTWPKLLTLLNNIFFLIFFDVNVFFASLPHRIRYKTDIHL